MDVQLEEGSDSEFEFGEDSDATEDPEVGSETFNDLSVHSFVSERLKLFYKEGRFTDCTLKADNTSIRAHKLVLAAASSFFEAQFNYEGDNDGSDVVLPFDGNLLKDVVDYIYFGKITINLSNIVGLMELQDYFQIASLRNLIHYYASRYTHGSQKTVLLTGALKLKPVAVMYRYHDLASALFSKLKQNFHLVIGQKEFLDISIDYLVECLESDVLNLKSEDELLLVLCRWVAVDGERHQNLIRLLNYVDTSSIKQWNKTVESASAIFQDHPALSESLNDWIAEKKTTRLDNPSTSVRSRYKSIVKPVLMSLGGIEWHGFDDQWPVRTVDCITSWYSEKWRPMIPTVDHRDSNLRNSVPVPLMKTPRLRPVVACDGTYVYVAGGQSYDVEMYDSILNRWISLPPLQLLNIDVMSMAVLDGALYVVEPGVDVVGQFDAKPPRFMILHKDSKTWQDLSPPNVYKPSILVSSLSSLYLLMNGDTNDEKLIWRYDASLDIWIVLGIQPSVGLSFNHICSCVSFAHFIYVTYNNMALYSYNTITHQWTKKGDPHPDNPLGVSSRYDSLSSTIFGYKIVLASEYNTDYLILLSLNGHRTKWLNRQRRCSGLAYFNLGLHESPEI